MSTPRSAIVLLALAAAVGSVAPACASDPVICSPANAGLGGQRAVVRRDLPGLDPKEGCNPHVEVIRSSDDLKVAYEKVGVHIVAPKDTPPGAIELPVVDFAKESVVLREAVHRRPASWIVASGETITIGSQSCSDDSDETCAVSVFAVDAVVTKAEAYTCDDVGCGGSSIPGSSGE